MEQKEKERQRERGTVGVRSMGSGQRDAKCRTARALEAVGITKPLEHTVPGSH